MKLAIRQIAVRKDVDRYRPGERGGHEPVGDGQMMPALVDQIGVEQDEPAVQGRWFRVNSSTRLAASVAAMRSPLRAARRDKASFQIKPMGSLPPSSRAQSR